jgi:uncharacterized paraquat-inducible protein A
MRKKSYKKGSGGNFHSLNCKYCNTLVERCDVKSVKVTCFRCTHKLAEGQRLEERK